jgi:type II secretory pathway predicted ATPase ExeA
MYNAYFKFCESPFENTLDQKFLFLSEDHAEVLAALLYFIEENKAFAIVCGDVGTGKTMLINCFLDKLTKYVHPIIVANPNIMYLDLLQYIGKELQLKEVKENILELTDAIKKTLIADRGRGKNYVLIVDEAHLLSDSSLEDIRLLSNIESRDRKLLQILLVGQYELSHKLDRPEMRQLRQRINISRFLSPLSLDETGQYLAYRLSKVGSDFDSCFESNCISLIFKITEGVPRMINQLCDNALLICMTELRQKVNCAILKKAQEVLVTDRIFTPKFSGRKAAFWQRFHKTIVLATGASFLLLGLLLGQRGLLGRGVIRQAADTSVRMDKAHLLQPSAGAAETPGIIFGPPNPQGEVATATKVELKNLPENGSAGSTPLPQVTPEPGPIGIINSPPPRQITVKPGDCLSQIVTQWYRKDFELGFEAIILANLKNSREDIIHPGQILFLPEINFERGIIQLRDNLYYAPYGRFRSFKTLEKSMSNLSEHKIRYLVINSINGRGATTHRLIIGGYETMKDLERILKTLDPLRNLTTQTKG